MNNGGGGPITQHEYFNLVVHHRVPYGKCSSAKLVILGPSILPDPVSVWREPDPMVV